MKNRYLGKSGLKVSALGLGTNAFGKRADAAASAAILHLALDRGINFIDTANIYAGTESERIIGNALKGRRQEAILATKAGLPCGPGEHDRGSSRHHLMRELENSLRRLQTDYVDLYQIHTFDPNTPLEETLRALDDMVRSGKVRYIGASNYAAWELMKALGTSAQLGLNRYVATQTSYSLADRTPETELVPLCLDQGVGIIPYFPLAGGILTGKYASTSGAGAVTPAGSRVDTDPSFARFLSEERIALGEQVASLAEEAGCTPAVLSISWLMQRPAVATVIVGATSAKQLEANLASVELQLSEAMLQQLDELSVSFRHGEPFAVYRLS
ncbi:aldo/keto reductase [Paenibacillus curdlanolyticus YK9]|uniref:Aldo/keto reductase n=1 Tax=Paenibacillus curdlanolyticus YK9 TaxID=717606 RepID=E0IFK1_9BACL|nr:aldo/keto reductase [Paenibacillus curdlanolyticus]EFM08667.1 aldo/keto reductase [Paenibacillus curdlanolyticus YK9]